MKIKELKNKNEKELKALLSEKTLALKNFRFAVAGSNTRNVKEGNVLKKDVARILTTLNKDKAVQNKNNVTKGLDKDMKAPKAN